jgi:hypothetical protein
MDEMKNGNLENLDNEEDMEEMEDDDLVIFETEDGEELTFSIEDYFFYNGEEYALLADVNEESEEDDEEGISCIVCKVTSETDENGEEQDVFTPVEDDQLAEKLFEIAMTKMDQDEEE